MLARWLNVFDYRTGFEACLFIYFTVETTGSCQLCHTVVQHL